MWLWNTSQAFSNCDDVKWAVFAAHGCTRGYVFSGTCVTASRTPRASDMSCWIFAGLAIWGHPPPRASSPLRDAPRCVVRCGRANAPRCRQLIMQHVRCIWCGAVCIPEMQPGALALLCSYTHKLDANLISSLALWRVNSWSGWGFSEMSAARLGFASLIMKRKVSAPLAVNGFSALCFECVEAVQFSGCYHTPLCFHPL